MKPTPGQILAAELKSRGIKKSQFAKMVGRIYQTVNNWTKDEGFGPEQRALCASKLGLSSAHFDNPTRAEQLESIRRDVIAEFRDYPMTPPLTDAEWDSVGSVRLPPDRVLTIGFLHGYVGAIRGDITWSQFRANRRPNDEADRANAADELAKSGNKRAPKKGAARTRRTPRRT